MKFITKSLFCILAMSLVTTNYLFSHDALLKLEDLPNKKLVIFESTTNLSESNNLNSSKAVDSKYEIRIILNHPNYDVELPSIDVLQKMEPSTVDTLLQEYRDEVSEVIFQDNNRVAKIIKNNTSIKNIIPSHYASLLTCDIDKNDIDYKLVSELNLIANNLDCVEDVYISEILQESYIPEYTLDSTFEKINVKDMVYSREFDGSGVKVGIVDAGILDTSNYSGTSSNNNDYYGRNIIKKPNQSGTSYHSDHVAMISVGNNGIAPGTDIYTSLFTGGINDYLGWMIDNDVNIVNTSFGSSDDATNGTYTSDAKIADQLIKDYFLVLVGSAGNSNTSPNLRITSPKTGFNYIIVGNSGSSSDYILSSSCFREQDEYHASKPTLMAPGTTTTNASSGTGTSFASPQVVGCLALLMEEFPYLKFYPELCTSIVTSSASPMSSTYNNTCGDNYYDGSGLHNQIGAGLLNYEKMREAANQYLSITRPKNSSTGIIPQYLDIVASDEQRIRASFAWLYEEDTFTDYDLELYKLDVDGTMDKVAYIDDSYNNVEFIDFDVKTTGTYRLVINQKEQNVANDYIGLSYVLIDDASGSTSGATNVDNTLSSHFKIDRSIYEDYGETYNQDEIIDYETNDGIYTFETTRKRARYTNDGKLVLSAKSNDSDSAYMEYKFDITDSIDDDWGLYNIKYQFGLWSDDESLIRKSSIDLYGLYHGAWLLIRHFDPKEMSTDPDNLKTYIDCLEFPVNGLRFYVKTNYTNNDNNVGRVVIGNIEGDIHYHLYHNYEQYNDYNHKIVCDCGDYHLQSHTWGDSYWVSNNEYANCTKCNRQHNMTSSGAIVTPIV